MVSMVEPDSWSSDKRIERNFSSQFSSVFVSARDEEVPAW